MTYKYEILSTPGLLTPGNTQHDALTTSAYRLVPPAHARVPADHFAVRFTASVAFVGGLALTVWWAAATVAAL